jgi:hypothetical protein
LYTVAPDHFLSFTLARRNPLRFLSLYLLPSSLLLPSSSLVGAGSMESYSVVSLMRSCQEISPSGCERSTSRSSQLEGPRRRSSRPPTTPSSPSSSVPPPKRPSTPGAARPSSRVAARVRATRRSCSLFRSRLAHYGLMVKRRVSYKVTRLLARGLLVWHGGVGEDTLPAESPIGPCVL